MLATTSVTVLRIIWHLLVLLMLDSSESSGLKDIEIIYLIITSLEHFFN